MHAIPYVITDEFKLAPTSREKLFFFPTIVLDLSPFERLSFDALISLCLMEEKYWVLSWPHLKLQLTLTL